MICFIFLVLQNVVRTHMKSHNLWKLGCRAFKGVEKVRKKTSVQTKKYACVYQLRFSPEHEHLMDNVLLRMKVQESETK